MNIDETPTNEEFLNIRIKLGLSHREFAKYCGVSLNCVKSWQSGASSVPISYKVTKKLIRTGIIKSPVKKKPKRYYEVENDDEG